MIYVLYTNQRVFNDKIKVMTIKTEYKRKFLVNYNTYNWYFIINIKSLTGRLNKFGVDVICDNWNGQISQIKLQSSGNYIDVWVDIGTDVCLLTICKRELVICYE